MPSETLLRRVGAILAIAALALPLSACNNTYGPPPNGVPQNWGQQHYLDVQSAIEQSERRIN